MKTNLKIQQNSIVYYLTCIENERIFLFQLQNFISSERSHFKNRHPSFSKCLYSGHCMTCSHLFTASNPLQIPNSRYQNTLIEGILSEESYFYNF